MVETGELKEYLKWKDRQQYSMKVISTKIGRKGRFNPKKMMKGFNRNRR